VEDQQDLGCANIRSDPRCALPGVLGQAGSLGRSFKSIVEPEDRHLAQIQFVVSAQNAFVIHKDDESFVQRDS
jgi:hypothetical protein